MSRIGSKNTKPELVLFKCLRERKLRYRKHYSVMGKPDAVLLAHRIAIFVDGEYWHGRGFVKWKNQLSEFWRIKIEGNIRRDRRNRTMLKKEGWKVIRIWGRGLTKNPDKCLRKLELILSEK